MRTSHSIQDRLHRVFPFVKDVFDITTDEYYVGDRKDL